MKTSVVSRRIIWEVIHVAPYSSLQGKDYRKNLVQVLQAFFPNAWWCNSAEIGGIHKRAVLEVLIPVLKQKFPRLIKAKINNVGTDDIEVWPLLEVGENDLPGNSEWRNKFECLFPSIHPSNSIRIKLLRSKYPEMFSHPNSRPGEILMEWVLADVIALALLSCARSGLSTIRCDFTIMKDNMYRPLFVNAEEYVWILKPKIK